MRQGQANKRSRGRPGNRKPSSGRSFDSNGPDVKIRGTAAHVYEKYQALARDAQASGDRIMAENYLQHAEHYYRVMLASEGGVPNQFRPDGGRPMHRDDRPRHEGHNGAAYGAPQTDASEDAEGMNGSGGGEDTSLPVTNGSASELKVEISSQTDSAQEQPEAGDFPTLIDTAPQAAAPSASDGDGAQTPPPAGRRPRRRRVPSQRPEEQADGQAAPAQESASSGNGSAGDTDGPSGS